MCTVQKTFTDNTEYDNWRRWHFIWLISECLILYLSAYINMRRVELFTWCFEEQCFASSDISFSLHEYVEGTDWSFSLN